MKFIIEVKVREYFDRINKNSTSGKFDSKLEYYWLCALVGLSYNIYNKQLAENTELTDKFTIKLKPFENEIRALLFYNYINKNLANQTNESILKHMSLFFSSDSLTKLSELGMNELNYYASGGFSIIQEKIPISNDLSNFLIEYLKLLSDKIGN
ncbi:MAG: hypothetical protein OEZ01_04890 [Candidatus Heimdallarchaeota archaeon]|nr:hypothetical protein [Candidatus Heimdallarchaeota archaeon]MDH5645318.1 hypothetical protein [Candidatus Heimdallarchaeota archaeon]